MGELALEARRSSRPNTLYAVAGQVESPGGEDEAPTPKMLKSFAGSSSTDDPIPFSKNQEVEEAQLKSGGDPETKDPAKSIKVQGKILVLPTGKMGTLDAILRGEEPQPSPDQLKRQGGDLYETSFSGTISDKSSAVVHDRHNQPLLMAPTLFEK